MLACLPINAFWSARIIEGSCFAVPDSGRGLSGKPQQRQVGVESAGATEPAEYHREGRFFAWGMWGYAKVVKEFHDAGNASLTSTSSQAS
jgi:hypothetical protein